MTAAVALDLGTTSIKAGLLSADGELVGVVARPAPEVNADGGRYESDALAYAQVADEVLAECLVQMGGLPQADAGPPLGLCCQRSSFLIWERATGRPVMPLISWQDDRGAAGCEALRFAEVEIRALAGLPITPYYLAPKLRVLLREHPAWREHLASGEWLLGTLDTFMIWRWTDGRYYRTDASMAARILLMDVHTRQWSPRLCELFGVPRDVLPEICDSTGWALPLNNGLTLMASVADQSAALVASIAAGSSEALVNLGTGGFVICHLSDGCAAPEGYLQTLLWQGGDGQAHFACEGTLNSIASALAPYPVADCRAEDMARDDIFCLAEPSGLGAPYFRKDIGLTFSASVEGLSPQCVATLLLEGIVFRVARMLEDMQREFGIGRVYLSGGLSNLPCLQQGIARCAPFSEVYLLPQSDAGLGGAARLAAGAPLVVEHGAGKIAIIRAPLRLLEKYACWKVWLDGLLNRRAAP
ncbi:MAG TPA: FGGY family carbohydrate kinase [Gallionella sp.]|nr:FGGY family carbohydrate kinase [Gallionella sp.]